MKIQSAPATRQSKAAKRIEVRSLVKTYRRKSGAVVNALDNVSVDIEAGEFLVLLGPSGCGKTTLLRSVAGLEVPNSGSISIGGTTVFDVATGVDLPPEARGLSMMFQSYALWPHMNALANVGFPLESHGRPGEEIRRRAARALELVGIGDLAQQFPAQMSGGQQQRVALARALVSEDGLILFDEPLSNVDAKVRERLRLELIRMHQEMGFTAIYVTHDRDEALVLADRIAVMQSGIIAQIDTPQALYDHPNSSYVASFLDPVNQIPGQILRVEGSSAWVKTPLGEAEARLTSWRPAVGALASLLIRPEHCDFSHSASPLSQPATVLASVFMGGRWAHILDQAGSEFQVMGPERLTTGSVVHLTLNPVKLIAVPAA